MGREDSDNDHQHGTRCRQEKPDPPERDPFEHKEDGKGEECSRDSRHDRDEDTVEKYCGKLGGLQKGYHYGIFYFEFYKFIHFILSDL